LVFLKTNLVLSERKRKNEGSLHAGGSRKKWGGKKIRAGVKRLEGRKKGENLTTKSLWKKEWNGGTRKGGTEGGREKNLQQANLNEMGRGG